MTYFFKTHLILWLIASHLKTFTSTKRNQNGRNDLLLVLFTLKSLCIQALALWQTKLPFSSLSLLSLFLSLLDRSLYWLYKTTFLRIECIMFLHTGKLYFLLMTHLSWIKAYSFTLIDRAFSFPKKPDTMLNDLPVCCSFSCIQLHNYPWVLSKFGYYRKCQSLDNTQRGLKNWTRAKKNVLCISGITRNLYYKATVIKEVW